MQIIDLALSDLAPYVNNSRTHSSEQIKQISESIQEFGFTNPILIDESKQIIAGHGRLMAAKDLGLDSVPCIILENLSDEQKRAYVIADNQLALNAGWDFDMMKDEIEALQDMEFDIDLLGFDDDFLSSMLDEGVNVDEAGFKDVGEQELKNTCPRCQYEFD